VVEAMAAGLPVVISNKVNLWREVDEARAGLVVSTDAAELASAITRLLDYPGLARQMGECGRRLARDKFSWNTAGEQLVRLYNAIISRQPGTSAGSPGSASVG
jgi:glycosyltransferase involved in cell wall biosynthesis